MTICPARPPGLPDEWLTAGTLDDVSGAVAELAGRLAEIAAREEDVSGPPGFRGRRCRALVRCPPSTLRQLAALVPPAVEIDSLSASEITELSRKFAADADMLQERLGSLSGLASMLGIRAPQTFQEAADLLTLARVAQEPSRPERAWLSASGLEAAEPGGTCSS